MSRRSWLSPIRSLPRALRLPHARIRFPSLQEKADDHERLVGSLEAQAAALRDELARTQANLKDTRDELAKFQQQVGVARRRSTGPS